MKFLKYDRHPNKHSMKFSLEMLNKFYFKNATEVNKVKSNLCTPYLKMLTYINILYILYNTIQI